jgi:hypothetical protein
MMTLVVWLLILSPAPGSTVANWHAYGFPIVVEAYASEAACQSALNKRRTLMGDVEIQGGHYDKTPAQSPKDQYVLDYLALRSEPYIASCQERIVK